ncbi:MAG: ABC transporter substrate-binding protein [Candidatus Woesearchaeota archaeon]|nr:ABC transporter substrate-binding protein [Candidatus Woesearchaeota archaeon]
MKRFMIALAVLLAACAAPAEETTTDGMTVYTIGWLGPLTGDGATYGLPLQRVTEKAVADLNEQWAAKNMKLEIIYEDGACAGRPALTAAQKLVNVDGVRIIHGGGCSGETLGIAPFTEANEVLLFSSLSSSPDVTNAGDYVFRNYPSDTAQVGALVSFIQEQGYSSVALLSENTDYAQALRRSYNEQLPAVGVEIVADEVVDPEARDVRAQMTKIADSEADAVLMLPQTVPMGGVFVKQYKESGIEAQLLGSEVFIMNDALNAYPDEMEGVYAPELATPEDEDFKAMQAATECEIGFYCGTMYDGVFIIAHLLEQCGEDTACMKDTLNALEDWEGRYSGATTFDENGDVSGEFFIHQVQDGAKVAVE